MYSGNSFSAKKAHYYTLLAANKFADYNYKMRKLFVCLANSRKLSGRCIAGIELYHGADGRLRMVENEQHQPKWIRPITQTEFGSLDANDVRHIKLGDLIEVEITEGAHHYNSYQTENVCFENDSLRVVEKLPLTRERLQKMAVRLPTPLFGSRGRAISMDNINGLYSSLTFIKVDNPSVRVRDEIGARPQERLHFYYNQTEYDLSLTDIEFVEKLMADEHILQKANEVYLTVSLSMPYSGKLYKLAAGVFMI